MSWLLEKVSIEGFRGINNAGDPLVLNFNVDKVNSVFAPNGVGKSSIFEAISYAIKGEIPKLERLQNSENASQYYLNRFHPDQVGTIKLTLKPEAGGASTCVTVSRNAQGNRTVNTDDGSDGLALLKAIDREFVLLDASTFHGFIEDTPLNRGRSFSGLLGLSSYSSVRQRLQSLANTVSLNNHFGVKEKEGASALHKKRAEQAHNEKIEAYKTVIGDDAGPALSDDEMREAAQAVMAGISLLEDECSKKTFGEISPDACTEIIRAAEGGEDREHLLRLLKQESGWKESISTIPDDEQLGEIVGAASERDAALVNTKGELFLKLFQVTEKIVETDEWIDKNHCPACDVSGEGSVLDYARSQIQIYDQVSAASDKLKELAAAIDWDRLIGGEGLLLLEEEEPIVATARDKILGGALSEETANKLRERVALIGQRAQTKLESITQEKGLLEKKLPPSLVAVTEKVEAIRRMQKAMAEEEAANQQLNEIARALANIKAVKDFLDFANKTFSKAESAAAARRLAAVQPLCKEFFGAIIFQPVVPSIEKSATSESLKIGLEKFFSLENVSALCLLSESYRNAFAISMYLAAASLFGGTPRFLILDDVTSSLDAGHQFHLMELIRTKFSRPQSQDGMQVIILSHDGLLEKYFNTQGSTQGWGHQRIEGTPRTAVLPQSNAVNRVRDATLDLLNAGNVQDAAPRLRQYLEYKLEEVIVRCKIPVPMAIAINDDRHMAGHLISAIDAQIKLHTAANSLILTPQQIQGLNLSVATITSNFLSHWSTGQTQPLAAGPLLGVMQAIEDYTLCFQHEPNPGDGLRYYRSLSQA